MKTISKVFFIIFTLGFVSNSYTQDYESLLKTKQFANIKQYMAEEVNVQFGQSKRLVSKEKAIQLLRQNLNEFGPVRWETLHQGASNEKNANYVILKLYNQDDEGVRLFLHLEESGQAKKITALRMREIL